MAFAQSYQPFVSLTYLVTLKRDTGISLDYCLLTRFFHEKTSSGHKIVLDKTETVVVVPVVRVACPVGLVGIIHMFYLRTNNPTG